MAKAKAREKILVRKGKEKAKIKESLVVKEMFHRIGITAGITEYPKFRGVVKAKEKIFRKENLVVENQRVNLKRNLTQINAVTF